MKKNIHSSGFTLVELLVTMGLMAMLATISIAGYFSAVRGMTERGVREDVRSLVRLAAERALVDNLPTAVYLMNTKLREENVETGEAERIVGTVVAVRMAGRISYIDGDYLVDEYADWDKTFRAGEGRQSTAQNMGMRLYRMVNGLSGKSCYSVVQDFAEPIKLKMDEELLALNVVTNGSNVSVYGFKRLNGGSAQWRVGDPYGFEISSLQLPHGYIFKGALPSSVGDVAMVGKVHYFFPDEVSSSAYDVSSFSFSGIDIQAYRPGESAPKTVESVNSSDLKDSNRNN